MRKPMPLWLQHLLVLVVVVLTAARVLWQVLGAVRGRGGHAGACCARGCGAATASTAAASPRGERVVFLPLESLHARMKHK
jgi:hypothetical protein